MKQRFIFFIAGLLGFSIVSADKNGPGGDYTGAPLLNGNPGSTCATTNCHDDGSSLNGQISLKFTEKGNSQPVTKYSTGKTYTCTVTVSGNSTAFGFSATILDFARLKTGTTNGAGTGAMIKTYNNRSIAMHNGPSSTGVFTFDWTPPATSVPDSVQLFAAANISNGNDNRFGDQIVKTSARFLLDKTQGITAPEPVEINIRYNFQLREIFFNNKIKNICIYNNAGNLVYSEENITSVHTDLFLPGIYFLKIEYGKTIYSEKILLQ